MDETARRLGALLQQAGGAHQRGDLAQAERLYQEVLRTAPANFAARHMLGVAAAQQGRHDEALSLIEAALELDPRNAGALVNYGNILALTGHFQDALASYDRALAVAPADASAWNNRGSALSNLGRHGEALASFARAVALAPRYGDALYNQGNTLCVLGRHAEAVTVYERLLALEPRHAGALNNLGAALWSLGRIEQALARHEAALALAPDFVAALNNRGNALVRLRRFDQALSSYARSLALVPNQPAVHESRAGLLLRLKRFAQALKTYEALLVQEPGHRYALGGAMAAAMNLCDWQTLARLKPRVEAAIARGDAVVPPYMFLALSDDPRLQLACARNAVADKIKDAPATFSTGRTPGERIRIAYISSDFCQHPVPQLIVRLIELHDRSRFEVLGISTGLDDGSAVRARIVKAFDHFHDMQAGTAVELAEQLRRMKIDILIDLNGHTEGDSFEILSHRPSPLQVSYLGYPATTGADFMDYILADAVVAADQAHFREQIVQLPDSYFVTSYDWVGQTPTREDAGLPPSGFVFCGFNNSFKITQAMFDAWMRLLQAVPGSVLWLLAANADFQANLRAAAQMRGVDPARLVFAGRADMGQHLARLGCADLMLDTTPFNGHTTTVDALWRGMPLVTLPGRSFASRVATSLLQAMEMSELVSDSLEAYEALALKLARNPVLLASLREKLARNRARTALFDSDRLRRHVEDAYATMWDRHQRGEPPQGFRVG